MVLEKMKSYRKTSKLVLRKWKMEFNQIFEALVKALFFLWAQP